MAHRQSFAYRAGRCGKESFRLRRELQAIYPELISIPDGCGIPHSSASAQVWGGATSLHFFPQDESDPTHSVQESLSKGFIQFLPQVGYVYIDHIVQRRVPASLVPNIPGEHFSRNNAVLVPKKVLE